TLDWLNHHRTGAWGYLLLKRCNVVVGHMTDAGQRRTKALGIFRLATDADGKQGTTVETIGAGDDFVLFRTSGFVRPTPRQLEGRFIGFGTGVGKKHLVGKGRLNQLA